MNSAFFAGVVHAREKAERCAGGLELARGAVGHEEEAGIVAGVDYLDFAEFRIETHEDRGDVAATGLFALAPVVLVHAGCEFIEGQAGDGHGAKGGAEAGGHHGGGQPFASHVSYSHEQAAVGLFDDVEVVAADFVAGDGAEGDGVAGNFRQ